jgi:uncharacterized protein (TIGR03663 family)
LDTRYSYPAGQVSKFFISYATVWQVSLIALIACLALSFRLPDLERRPMHTDEAVQAKKTGNLLEKNEYRYNPKEFHGPTIYYLTLPVLALSSVKTFAQSSEFHYRIVPVIFGSAMVLLLLLILDAMGGLAAPSAGLMIALSPCMVFYSRYYIQEMLLAFFTLALIGCGWRWHVTRAWKWALLGGACFGLLHATKETFVIAVFAMAAGVAVHRGLHPRGPVAREGEHSSRWRYIGQAGAALALAACVSLCFYSSFFANWRGVGDSILTYGNYLKRTAAENPHDKPMYYYLKLLTWNYRPGAPIWSEAFIVVLALAGAADVFLKTPHKAQGGYEPRVVFARFLSVYTLFVTAGYSLISYKTPWCVLTMELGLILLAGFGVAALIRRVPHWSLKAVVAVALAGGVWHLGWQAKQASGRFAYDTRNPYVYAHPTQNTVDLCKRVVELAAVHPQREYMLVHVIAEGSDYWPLPWYLRTLKNVGYTDKPPLGPLDAPVLIASPDFDAELSLELKRHYQINTYGLRPEMFTHLYVDLDLWNEFMKTRRNVKPRAAQ